MMKYIEVVEALADQVGVPLADVCWLTPNADGLENITQFELFWDGQKDGKPMHISKVFKKSEYPDLFEAFVRDSEVGKRA